MHWTQGIQSNERVLNVLWQHGLYSCLHFFGLYLSLLVYPEDSIEKPCTEVSSKIYNKKWLSENLVTQKNATWKTNDLSIPLNLRSSNIQFRIPQSGPVTSDPNRKLNLAITSL